MSGNTDFGLPHKFEWSNCSVQKRLRITTEFKWTCLFKETNKEEIDLSKALFPGEILSLDNYCKKLTHYKACNVSFILNFFLCK